MSETALEVVNMKGDIPGLKAVRGAIGRVTSSGAVDTNYKNCGRKKTHTDTPCTEVVSTSRHDSSTSRNPLETFTALWVD